MALKFDKAVSSVKLCLARLQSIHDLVTGTLDDKSRLVFISACRNACDLYEQVQDIAKRTVVDESSELAETFSKLLVDFDSIYFQVVGIKLSIDSTEVKAENSIRGSTESLHTSQPASNVKLPRINLPNFDGKLKNWVTYYDLFKTMIHVNISLSPIEKFQYLVSTLSGEPLTLVKHLPLTADNYQVAFDTLVERYQNERVLATSYWQALCNAQKLSNSNSPQPLRDLLNVFTENLSALGQFSDIDLFDFTLFNWLLQKIDPATRERFELQFSSEEFPTYKQLHSFLSAQCRALESSSLSSSTSSSATTSGHGSTKHSSRSEGKKSQTFLSTSDTSTKQFCFYCKGNHPYSGCRDFLNLDPHKRFEAAKSARVCLNCFGSSHSVKQCSSNRSCKHCAHRHHSLLHFVKSQSTTSGEATPHSDERAPTASTVAMSSLPAFGNSRSSSRCNTTVLLATACVEIQDKWGNYQVVRALCDSGSQSSFLTDRCRKRLGLQMNRSSTPISCLGHVTLGASQGTIDCTLRPVGATTPIFEISTLVLPNICGKLPSVAVSPNLAMDNVKLADPSWYTPGNVDLLLGADIFPNIITDGYVPGSEGRPAAMNTAFGWVLLGTISSNVAETIQTCFASVEANLDDTLKAFWRVEEVPSVKVCSLDEQKAELSFVETHYRDQSGRFGVSLPFRDPTSLPVFLNSFDVANRRLLALERRLAKQPQIRDLYVNFMQEYLDAGHMSLVSIESENLNSYYIPHHCVLKEPVVSPPNVNVLSSSSVCSSTPAPSSKIRVVFDASAKASNSISLNDTLFVGPKLQNDIASVLLRFRETKFVFTCDIRQMYRQILVSDSHRPYQLVRWRFSESDPIRTYQLNTVTYGVSSSPYLAIRCLLKLAQDHQDQYPLASRAIRFGLYVDDFAVGANSVDDTLELRNQLISLLKLGQFELRKWSANHPEFIQDLPVEYCQQQASTFDTESDFSVKILGLQWQSTNDSFSFVAKSIDSPCTKRSILSEIARIYDPLGFLCPLTFLAKRIIQHLWYLGLDWDDDPPEDVVDKWNAFKSTLHLISNLSIPRCLRPEDSFVSCQLHAFCDASTAGYAGVVYYRFEDVEGNVKVYFVTAKSRVAPLKPLSIPRLELCAAVLLSDLVDFVLKQGPQSIVVDQVFAWSDSSVALCWIQSSPHRWKTFVSNRVVHIQDRIPPDRWRHVRSGDNPADAASRGLLPEDLIGASAWWAGPEFLKSSQESWPSSSPVSSLRDVDLEKRNIVLISTVEISDVENLLSRFSSLRKIQGIIAWCLRFVHNCSRADKLSGPLSTSELHAALMRMVVVVQSSVFSSEIDNIRAGRPCSKYLQKLSPFVDNSGVLRVGGRLLHSGLAFEAKYPALLPKNHRLSELLIEQVHREHLHPGVNTTLYLLQQNFWIVSARTTIRKCLSKCIRCFRTRPIPLEPPMGNLPVGRVSQAKPFSRVGVDYGGPFPILLSRRRGTKTSKAYLCLFVCFATRAIHLEIASDLSSDTFIAALKRFVSRRGRCSDIHSDCGTNFVGANRELNSLLKTAAEGQGIRWHFNPPSSPHFGGLWESGVKSVKTHMARVIGGQILTYEELNTLAVQIEAVLNSRPLCPISSDPNDLTALTPGHFLTLEPLTSIPDVDLSHLNLSRLSRWQLVQQMHRDFWKRWKTEYLHTFHQRSKWSKTHRFDPAEVGSLVLIKDELLSPLKWSLGRIVSLHPGADGVARVASVHTTRGLCKRPLVKLCPLPNQ